MALLDERKRKILQAIIEDYVATAEPVGSRTISRKYQLGISPATIRNEMADLEELGFIEQPHTSAGRIPSGRGYRFYVDYLMPKEQTPVEVKTLLDKIVDGKTEEPGELAQKTARFLTNLTNYPALASSLQWEKKIVRCLQVLPLNDTQGIVVLVSEGGNTESDIIELPSGVSRDELDVISHILTEKLRGVTWDSQRELIIQGVEQEVFRYKAIWEQIRNVLNRKAKKQEKEKVFLEGTARILNQPEFRDLEKLRTILGLLEEEDSVRSIITESRNSGITAKIGEENSLAEMVGCSLVTATCRVDGEVVGTIGVLGPTRMDYKRVFTVLEFITESLEKILTSMVHNE